MAHEHTCSETLLELLAHHAENIPKSIAYHFLSATGQLTARIDYEQLFAAARMVGSALVNAGAEGERVIIFDANGLEFLSAFFAIQYAGAIAVPLSPFRGGASSRQLQSILANAEAKFAIAPDAVLSRLFQIKRENVEFSKLRLLSIAQLRTWDTPVVPPRRIDEESPILLQYTSGSTSVPKGVQITSRNLRANARQIVEMARTLEEYVGVSWLPLFHDMGLMLGAVLPLEIGRPTVLMTPNAFLARPQLWLEAISRFRATVSGAPNFAFDLCAERIAAQDVPTTLDLSCWQVAFCGAEPVRPETLNRFCGRFRQFGFRRRSLLPCYGLAEATVFATGGPAMTGARTIEVDTEELAAGHVVTASTGSRATSTIVGVGEPARDAEVLVVDPITTLQCPEHRVGEVWVRGPNVSSGYWNRPEENATTFQAQLACSGRGPFLRTGDLGFLRNNELYVVGRMKDLIIINGQNHYPEDLEYTVQTSDVALGAMSCVAVSIERAGREHLGLVQESQSTERHVIEALGRTIHRSLLDHHGVQVHSIAFVRRGSLPRTTSGKVQRYLVRIGLIEGKLDLVHVWTGDDQRSVEKHVAPRTPIEKLLVEIWSDVLAVDPVGIDDNFFELGGESLTASRVASRIFETLGVEPDLRTLFEAPTIRKIAEYIVSDTIEKLHAVPEPASDTSTHTLTRE